MFLQFYGLDEQPFGVTPDPRFLYMGPSQQEAFSSLIYGLETGRGFLALIARPGLGKTTMVLRLIEQIGQSARTAFLFQTQTSSQEFLRNLLVDLDVEPRGEDPGELQRQFGDLLIKEAETGRRIVVLIDEAQNLDDGILEMIRMLSNFETPRSKLLQVVLVGQPQLANKLASPHLEQLRQRISIITHFPPLTTEDVPKYIDHRLQVAGYGGGGLFTPGALKLIVAYANGIPRNINNICFQALSLGYAKDQKTINDAIVREVIADLSLECPGTPLAEATEVAPITKVRDRDVGVNAAPPPVSRVDEDLLDAVELSGEASSRGARTIQPLRRLARRTTSGNLGRSTRDFALLAVAAILVGLCLGPWLRPGLESMGQLFRQKPLAANVREAKTTSAILPAAANSLNVPANSSASRSNSGGDSERLTLGPENLPAGAPTLSRGPGTPASADSLVPPTIPDVVETPRLSASDADESLAGQRSGDGFGKGKLVVESSISGARISVNGRSNPDWKTPHLFSLAPGTYLVSVSGQGYETWTKRVHVDEGREKYVDAELENHDGGLFTVETFPSGMQVYIDGKPFGPSRVETVLSSGWHVCEVIPGPGLQGLVSRFHLNPGQAVTRRIRMGSPEDSENDQPHAGAGVTTLAAGSPGGTP